MESQLYEKLKVLSDSAKYDVSCSSSGVERKNVGRTGSASCAGICHSWGADGRCISLLKVLLSNDCVYDCAYCANRRSADVARATFEPNELADLTMEFYRRNYIEGLFLSSAVAISPDDTAEKIYKCLYLLREVYGFAGYIHAKIIPGVSPEILHHIGMVADRLSVNVELPSEDSLNLLAPQKKAEGIFTPMKQIMNTMAEQKTLKSAGLMDYLNPIGDVGENISVGDGTISDVMSNQPINSLVPQDRRKKYKEKFAPAGQTTQMIIGASPESDQHILKTSEALYRKFKMKRVYFSAYIPVVSSPNLPSLLTQPPLKREHRLYQADWLLRFYGFTADEILADDNPFLDPDLDPKITWALRHIEMFPIEVNKASLEELLRIPGVGNISAKRIIRQRKVAAIKFDDLKKIGVVVKRAKYFLTCKGQYHGEIEVEPNVIRDNLLLDINGPQISMFDSIRDNILAGGGKNALPLR